MAKKEPLTQKKLQAVFANENQHLIGVEMGSSVDNLQVTFASTLENVGVKDGIVAMTLTTAPSNTSEDELYRGVLGVYDTLHIGINYSQESAPTVTTMAGIAHSQSEEILLDKLNVLIDLNDDAWVTTYKMAGVKTTEVYLRQEDTAGTYYVRLLFSEEENLHGLSSYINIKLNKPQTAWIVTNSLSPIFGTHLGLVYLEQQTTGLSLMLGTPMTFNGSHAQVVTNEEGTELLGIAVANEDGLATGTINLEGYRAEVRESNGVYAIVLTKEGKNGEVDKVTLFIR